MSTAARSVVARAEVRLGPAPRAGAFAGSRRRRRLRTVFERSRPYSMAP